jgi:alpha-L-fucosidase
VPEYHWAPTSAYEAFRGMKFGVRLHWGLYSIWHRGRESWPFLKMSFEDRRQYNELYKTWNPVGFDAEMGEPVSGKRDENVRFHEQAS